MEAARPVRVPDVPTTLILLGIGFAAGFMLMYHQHESKIADCHEVADQTDYFGPTVAGKAMAFAECMSPKRYRLRAK